MPQTRSLPAADLVCPLCSVKVPVGAAACRQCHLPIADVRRGQNERHSRTWVKAVRVRLVGIVLYAAVIAWCALQLPASLPFVAPAAVVGVALHGVRGRPWLGLLAFVVLVVSLPFVLAPALGTGAFSDLADWINDPQW